MYLWSNENNLCCFQNEQEWPPAIRTNPPKLISREDCLLPHVGALTQPHWATWDLGAGFLKNSSGLAISNGTGSQSHWNLVCKKNSLLSVVFRGTAVKHFVYMELNSYNLAAWGRNEVSWGRDGWLFPSIFPFPFKGPQFLAWYMVFLYRLYLANFFEDRHSHWTKWWPMGHKQMDVCNFKDLI